MLADMFPFGLVNLTPHDLTVYNEAGQVVAEIPRTGYKVRAASETKEVQRIGGIPIYAEALGKPTLEFPDGTTMEGDAIFIMMHIMSLDIFDGVLVNGLIMSRIAAEAMRRYGWHPQARPILYVPGPLIRDSEGRVIGCQGLVKAAA